MRHDVYVGASLAIYGEWSEIELSLLLRLVKPGATVVEVGANIGSHSVALARRVGSGGRLIAFEPQQAAFDLLASNLAINGQANAELWLAAAGAAPGEGLIPIPDYTAPGNFGGVALGETGAQVEIVTLDEAVGERPVHLVKIDAEGMEVETLDGAAALIHRDRPIIYLENDRTERSPTLIRRLFSLGYRAFWHLPPLFNPHNHGSVTENLFPGIVSVNMLCVPEERKVNFAKAIIDPDEHPFGNRPL